MRVLTINAGSSSLKVALYEHDQMTQPLESLALENQAGSDFTDALATLRAWCTDHSLNEQTVHAIGHRVVHGGNRYAHAARISDELLTYLASITSLAPNHMPSALQAIHMLLTLFPSTPQVACFDTSFFHTIPKVAQTLAIPLSLQREAAIRRYGFHGLSYSSLLASFGEHEGAIAAHGRIIMCHLGSGASIAALKDGAPIDMSMGFTPVSGIMMSTRSGDIEPGVLTFLQEEMGLTSEELFDLVAHKSGLLGVSETTGDMHTLLQAQQSDERAALAVELFCYTSRKTIGSFAATLGGIDSIIFSGGIGERSAEIRARICEGLGFMGVKIDDARNSQSERLISSDASRVGVHVIASQEDVSIIRDTVEIIQREGMRK